MTRRNQRSAEARAWRPWYSLKRWSLLKDATHLRDGYQCRMCGRLHPTRQGLVADHIQPHKGDPALFWDPDNLQTLCQPCHDRHKQAQERGTLAPAIGVDGWPAE